MSLPDALTHQDKLLTINTNAQPYLTGLLHPGIQAVPLFLAPYNGTWIPRKILTRRNPSAALPYWLRTAPYQEWLGCQPVIRIRSLKAR